MGLHFFGGCGIIFLCRRVDRPFGLRRSAGGYFSASRSAARTCPDFTRVRIPQESLARASSGFSSGLVTAYGQKCNIGFRTKVSVETPGNGLRSVSACPAPCRNEDTAFVNFSQQKILCLNEFRLSAQLRPLRSATAKSFCRAWHVGESAEIFLPEGGFYRWSKQ